MKKIFSALLISIFVFMNFFVPAEAGFFSDKKSEIIQNYQNRTAERTIRKILEKQTKAASKHDYTGLFNLYAQDFINTDGFTKDIYFKLIKDTWTSYPDIAYTTEIKNITVDGNTASAEVYETSLATSTQLSEGIKLYGELHSYSNGVYYFKKIKNKWLISGEKVYKEKSFLKYGDTRFIEMDLISPEKVTPNEYYTASLRIDLPENAFAIASIGKDEIIYPQNQAAEVFRKMPDDNILERMFYANKNGKNEYNVASIGVSKSEQITPEKIRVYIAGLAFIMTRVNVEDEVENAPKDK